MTTIADVAKAAGVSISTVSYVTSGKRAISAETRDRVLRVIEALDYHPHAGARSLASRATQVLGLQAPLRAGVDVPVVMQIVSGIVRTARDHHYDILLLADDDVTGLERAAGSSLVDALLVMDISSDDPRIATLAEAAVPGVLVGMPAEPGDHPFVDFDFESAGRLAAERLIGRGHRRIALLGASPEVLSRGTAYAERLNRGFVAAATATGVIASVHPVASSLDAADEARRLFAEDPTISGVFVHNEAALPHVLPATGDRDVIALAPLDVARSAPGLTELIELPTEQLGHEAARLALELLGVVAPADGAAAGTNRRRLLAPHVVDTPAV